MDIWSGLKLPIDSTGSNLKSDKCRPKLQLDGLEPEVLYRTCSDSSPLEKILFPEFRPRKRLKKSYVTEEPEPLGVKRLPEELRFGTDGGEPYNSSFNSPFDSKNIKSDLNVKSEITDWNDDAHQPISLTESKRELILLRGAGLEL